MNQLRVTDACCGGGLLSAGMETAGLKVVMGIDNDPVAISSFQANFPNAVAYEVDLLEIKKLPRCEVLVGGPPCQPFSKANRRPSHEAGMALVEKFIELAKSSGVRYWVMEEVPPVAEYIRDCVPRLEVWDCAQFGCRQIRPRMFAGDFPDPVTRRPPCTDPVATVMASEANLSIEEARALQGVPGWMQFMGTIEDQRRMIGNGVPLEVGEALGLGILYHAQGRTLTGNVTWHTLGAGYHRERGGSRSYLSARDWRWCEDCQGYVYIGPGIPRSWSHGVQGTPLPADRGTPRSKSKGTPSTSRTGTPSAPATGTPRAQRKGTPPGGGT